MNVLKKLYSPEDRRWTDCIYTFKAEEFEIIKTLSHEYSIKTLCEAMEVSRAGYYKWLNKKTTKKDIRRAEAVELVTKIHEARR